MRISVCNPEGRELVSSPILFNAGANETIDLVVDGGDRGRNTSEYERLVSELQPMLQGISLSDLTEDENHQDITFLSNETQEPAGRITFLVLASIQCPRTPPDN